MARGVRACRTSQTLAEMVGEAIGAAARVRSGVCRTWPASTFRIRSARRSARTAISRRACFRASWSRDMCDALRVEIARDEWPWTPETVYLGGGTPSQMDADALARASRRIPAATGRRPRMEAAPGSITRGKSRRLAHAGSIASASACNRSSRELAPHRPQTHGGDGRERYRDAARGGITNFNIDLIAGLPGQTAASWNDRWIGSSGWSRRMFRCTCSRSMTTAAWARAAVGRLALRRGRGARPRTISRIFTRSR